MPRWQAERGSFEVWFLVVFEPEQQKAWWFRYTLFAPSDPAGARRATLWAAAFDARSDRPAVAAKALLPIEAFDGGEGSSFGIRIGEASLTNGTCQGAILGDRHAITWDLRFEPRPFEAGLGPRLLHALPLPTRVAHANQQVPFSGEITVDGVRHCLERAVGLQTHIWGTRRVEDLYWLYCPSFRERPETHLEAFSTRPRLQLSPRMDLPFLSAIALEDEGRRHHWGELPLAMTNQVRVSAQAHEVTFIGRSPTHRIVARAHCMPETLVGYAYRDPQGWDAYVAQSDIASCEVQTFRRPHPFAPWQADRHLTADRTAALEFHSIRPLAGIPYLGWDQTELVAQGVTP